MKVAVLRCHGRDDCTEAEREPRHHEDEDREQQGIPGKMRMTSGVDNGVDHVNNSKESELDTQFEQVARYGGHGHHKPGEIDFSENIRITDECIRRTLETTRKIRPHARTGQIEQRTGHAVGRNSRNATEHDHVHKNREGRLDYEPCRTQNRLLVLRDNVSLNEQGVQIPV